MINLIKNFNTIYRRIHQNLWNICQHTQESGAHDKLALFPCKYLATPATTVPCEWLFSVAGNIVNKRSALLSVNADDDVRLLYLFCQVSEAYTALQKTTEQVQKLAKLVNKHSPGAPALRSPTQPPSQSGEWTCLNKKYSVFDTRAVCCVSPLQVYMVQCQQCLCPRFQLSPSHSPTQTCQRTSSESGWTFWERNAPRPGTKAPWLLSALLVRYRTFLFSLVVKMMYSGFIPVYYYELCVFPACFSWSAIFNETFPLSICRKRCI